MLPARWLSLDLPSLEGISAIEWLHEACGVATATGYHFVVPTGIEVDVAD